VNQDRPVLRVGVNLSNDKKCSEFSHRERKELKNEINKFRLNFAPEKKIF